MKKKILLISMFVLAFTLILLSSNANADYKSDSTTDAEFETGYSLIFNNTDCKMYYGNSNDFHFFYANFTYTLEGKTILLSSTNYQQDLSPTTVEIPSVLYSIHINETLEFKISRSVVGNLIGLQVLEEDFSILMMVNPSSTGHKSSGDDDEDERDIRARFTVMDFFGALFRDMHPIHWFLLGGFIIGSPLMGGVAMWRLRLYPIIVIQDGVTYEAKKLGRVLKVERSKILPDYWEFRFKSGNRGVDVYYSSMSLDEMREQIFRKVWIIEEEYPEFIEIKLNVAGQGIPEKVRVDSWKNKFIYYTLRVVCRFLWNNRLTLKLYDKIMFKETGEFLKEVPLIQFSLTMKRITTVVDIKYDKLVPDEKKKEVVETIEEIEIPIFRAEDIEKDPTVVESTIEITNERRIVRRIKDIKEAIHKRNSENELRSIMDLQEKLRLREHKELIDIYNKTRMEYLELEREFERRVAEEISKMHYRGTETKLDFIKRFIGKTADGQEIKKAIVDAEVEVKKQLLYKEHGEILAKYESMKAKTEEQERTIKFLQTIVGNGGRFRRQLPQKIPQGDDFSEE